MSRNVTAILMLGREGASEAERWVAGARAAAARDAVTLLSQAPAIDRIVLATSEAELPRAYPHLPVTWDVDAPGAPFHFGTRLGELLERYPAPAQVYLGAGSMPLLPPAVLAEAAEEVARADSPCAITNNLHSSDWMVLNPAAAAQIRARPERLPSDNALGWVLKTEGGVAVRGLPASAATRLDIDTPADLLLLALHPNTGPALRQYLADCPRDSRRWLAGGQRLFAPGGQVALIGRVASSVWAYVEAHTQAWIRVFSEERGMSASGRLAAGQVQSLIGAHLRRVGARKFFDELSQMVEAAFFDTRVLLAYERRWPTPGDRYASDLGLVEAIDDPYLRQLTEAARQAPIPIVLGGHGVVAGDLFGLVEVAEAGRLAD
jgi:hypothetical protein